jgi:hypothetical protein
MSHAPPLAVVIRKCSIATFMLATSSLINQLMCNTVYHPEDHVWFEDRWMVASLCDE